MKISVITVCHNSRATIEQTIQSVVSQNYSDLEYIIIDGGSTDGTLDIIAKYQRYISLCISETDHGIYDAMNKGLQKCTGDIVAFLNSDDWYGENVLTRVNQYFENTKPDIVSGNIFLHSADGKSTKIEFDRENSESVFFAAVYPQPALFVRKGLYRRLGGFDTSYKIAADTAWMMNACTEGVRVLCVEDYFTYFREGGLSCRKKYEAIKEQYNAALVCAQNKGMTQIAIRIEKYYSSMLKSIMREQMFNNALDKHCCEVKKIFDNTKTYYIWGAGVRGKACLDLFTRLEIPVSGFLDRNLANPFVEGFSMVTTEEIGRNCCICITPKGHEQEIKEQLIKAGMNERNLLTYSDLLEQIAALGKFEEL